MKIQISRAATAGRRTGDSGTTNVWLKERGCGPGQGSNGGLRLKTTVPADGPNHPLRHRLLR